MKFGHSVINAVIITALATTASSTFAAGPVGPTQSSTANAVFVAPAGIKLVFSPIGVLTSGAVDASKKLASINLIPVTATDVVAWKWDNGIAVAGSCMTRIIAGKTATNKITLTSSGGTCVTGDWYTANFPGEQTFYVTPQGNQTVAPDTYAMTISATSYR